MAKQLGESLDTRIPEAFVAAEPIVGALERPRIDAAVVNSSTHGAFHEPGPLESLDVLRRGSERHPVGCGELPDRLLAFCEPLEHRTAGAVAECPEDEIESSLLFNHEVEYTSRRLIVNQLVEG